MLDEVLALHSVTQISTMWKVCTGAVESESDQWWEGQICYIYAILLFFFSPETRLVSLLSFYLFYVSLLGGCVDLLFVLPVLLLCLVIRALMLSHLSSPLFILDALGWDLCNDLLEIFLLWQQGDSSMSWEASVFAECIRITEINKNVVRS